MQISNNKSSLLVYFYEWLGMIVPWSYDDKQMVSIFLQSTLNEEIIKPPYENQVFKFENSGGQANIYIKPIRSYVSLSSFNNLLINLAMEHFYNNTQGQCGMPLKSFNLW